MMVKSLRTNLLISALLIYVGCDKQLEKKLLILGGNGFIGSHLINSLITEPYRITILNRGNKYFDSKAKIEPYVHRIINCDRKTLLRKTCHELLEPIVYDVVIDFSSYTDQQIEQIIDILQNKVKMYIYISTDVVYDVRDKKHNRRTREEDARNRFDINKENKMVAENQYGFNKLSCEERLVEQRKKFGFPYVILRLADAIGERDTTMRWWAYQVLIKLHKHLNISVPLPNPVKSLPFSMVYAGDVADTIVKIIENTPIFQDEVINLAFDEEITLEGLLIEIGTCINITNIEYEKDENIAWLRYPSVQRGAIDTRKAKMIFNWSPTSFQKALQKTCSFFENAMVDMTYAVDREIFLAEFIEEVLPVDFTDENLFSQSLIKAYGPLVFKGIDLGFDVDLEEKRIENKEEL